MKTSSIFLFFIPFVLLMGSAPPLVELESDSAVVVQLFTSQGCSSCPSADELLEQIKNEYDSNVIVLSYHVDYWNRLGWKDPFSKKEYSNLQYRYSQKFDQANVYTPQAIINGDTYFVGSNKSKMYSNINDYLKTPSKHSIDITSIQKKGNEVIFSYDISGNINSAYLKATLVIENRETKVVKGENLGRTLKNSNIVVEETDLIFNNSSGTAMITIPDIVEEKDELRLVLFTYDQDLLITGAKQSKINN